MAAWKQAEEWEWESPATGWRWTVRREGQNRYTATVRLPEDDDEIVVLQDRHGAMKTPPRRTNRRTTWPTSASAREACEILDAQRANALRGVA